MFHLKNVTIIDKITSSIVCDDILKQRPVTQLILYNVKNNEKSEIEK